ncbi:anaphase promoting complex subunit bimA [Aspergillus affinis]|uniref:anaphase promoting complex subunit bimA n=1 Tax=Aspergillus affinis TaxID=1070780 RepID=UPI0022FED62D|nr:DNA-binding cell division cycle control protein [Aspergillus affinis]KAI9038042.1 DNA-binding cell division cycle control protein [Aspergillus affinis]
MSPSTSHISSQLRQLIYYHLDNNLIRTALFLAGRLHAYEPRTSEASYLLALCHLLSGQVKSALDYSRNFGSRGTHLGCSYVYAQACLDLGKELDGITALERSKSLWASKNHWNKHNETRRQHLPDAAAVMCLLGKLWYAHKENNKAVDCYVEALRLNPFMWDAFMGLCETGVNVRVPNIYKMNSDLLAVVTSSMQEDADLATSDKATPAAGPLQSQANTNSTMDPFTAATSRADSSFSHGSSVLWEKLNGSTVSVASTGTSAPIVHEGTETPGGQSSESDEFRIGHGAGNTDAPMEPPLAPARKNRTIQSVSADHGMDPPPKMRPTGIRQRTRTKPESEEHATTQAEKETVPSSRVGDRKRTVSGQVAHSSTSQPTEPGAPQRRSVRLFNQIKPTTSKFSGTTLGMKDGRELKKVKATGAKGRSTTAPTMGRVVSGSRKPAGDIHDSDGREHRTASTHSGTQHTSSRTAAIEKSKSIEALTWLLELFAKLASGHFALTRYRCSESIQIFNALSQGQRETPWVLSQIGRAYYEQAMYSDAEKYFVRVRTMVPSRLEDMEIYSTVLWHLKNDVELAHLAHELMDVDRLSPQAWCAIGNSFSHQRDHDQALKCFKRATQLDPQFAYGFTLQGHEYVANEEYDKALDAYRHGISADNRHYNAWYGLATVYDKMGKLDFAEQHFRNAATINPTNAVLICCIGLVLEKMNNPRGALTQYGRACLLAPHSVLARFRKARVCMKLHELKSALTELKILKDMAPDEPNVHYLLGKLYKMLHDKGNAIKHFTTALNLDPKAAQYIKDAMESLDDDEEDDEDMA